MGNLVGTAIGRPWCELSEYEEIVDESLNNIEKIYHRARLDKYVILPDESGRPMGAPTIPNMVNQLKGKVSIY